MTGTCLCGACSITIEGRPEFIHDCNCSLCRKVGAAWAYFSSPAVRLRGSTVTFVRPDKAVPAVEVHSCSSCSVTTHFQLTRAFTKQNPSADLTGVNMRLFEPDELAGVEVRFPDGKGWSGAGPFEYRRAAFTIGTDAPW